MNGKERVSLLVLNDYLKFDRKIYQFMGFSFGRAIKVKTIVYFFLALAAELLLFFVPGVSSFLKMLPEVFLLIVPFSIAYLLSDIATEGRSSVHYFRSVVQYVLRRNKQVTYCHGREVTKPKVYRFKEIISVRHQELDPYTKIRAQAVEKVMAKREQKAKRKQVKLAPQQQVPMSQPTEQPALTPLKEEKQLLLTVRMKEGD